MPPTRFSASIGRQRIASGGDSSLDSIARDTRAGMQEIIKRYTKFVDHTEAQMPTILYEALLPVFWQSQEEVPIDTGDLKGSGYLITRVWRGKQSVEIGYGKAGAPPYASVVHENLEAWHASPTKAKFLEDPLRQQERDVQRRIIEAMEVASGV